MRPLIILAAEVEGQAAAIDAVDRGWGRMSDTMIEFDCTIAKSVHTEKITQHEAE